MSNKIAKSYPFGELGSRIRRVREYLTLEQQQLADLLKISSTTMNRYEMGHREASPGLLTKLAQLDQTVNPEWLFTGRGEMVIRDDAWTTPRQHEATEPRAVRTFTGRPPEGYVTLPLGGGGRGVVLTDEEEEVIDLYRRLTRPARALAVVTLRRAAGVPEPDAPTQFNEGKPKGE